MATRYKKPKAIPKTKTKSFCKNEGCLRAGRALSSDEFYKSRDASIVHHPYCKDCINSIVDINDLRTVYDILNVLDTPFIIDEWNEACRMTDTNQLGKYLSIINFSKRSKYIDMRFRDSVYGYKEGEHVEDKTETRIEKIVDIEEAPTETLKWSDEWQGKYTDADLKYLNDYYTGLTNDFKIVTTNHKDYARKIAQASLSQTRAFQQLQEGKDGADVMYEKATKLFDMLSKSAQFAESQRGANDVSLGCFGRVFDAVEKHNWVPKFIPDDEDMYDKLLKQFSNIERSL